MTDRTTLARHILDRIEPEIEALAREFETAGKVRSAVIDDLLPEAIALRLHEVFPQARAMSFKNSIKERKLVSAQMDRHDPMVEEAVYAFQDPLVVAAISRITGMAKLEPDVDLYAGGVSAMRQGHYLKPHLDNSHDATRERYRALNLLYYVTPGWREEYGGHLQLWDNGPRGQARTVHSKFNRLVLMETTRGSWHSVSRVAHDGVRCCVSNYYFTPVSPEGADYFHATSFRGEPGELSADLVMRADNAMRTAALKILGDKWVNPHAYHRDRS